MSTGAYSPSKASAWPDRIQDLREGRQPYPVHVQIILSDLCDLDCPQCFVPGTMIYAAEGPKPIDAIRKSDIVFTGQGQKAKVTETHARFYSGSVILLMARNGQTVVCTPEHPIQVAKILGGPASWTEAQNILVGDWVTTWLRANHAEASQIVEAKVVEGYESLVYNFEVDSEEHSYIANGIVVHNCAYRLSGYTSNQLFSVQRPDGTFNHNPNRMLDPDLVKSIIDDCVAMGVRAIQFTGGGEPTIHPQARELIVYAQDKGLDTALVTNGLHLDRLASILPRLSWLRVSVDAATPETYAKVRPSFGGKAERSKQNWEKLLSQMDRAITHLREVDSACVVGAGFVVQEENWREQAAFVRLFRDLGVDNVRISGAFTPSGEAYHAAYREEALAVEREAAALARPGFAVHARFSEKLDDLAARPDYRDCWYQQFTTYVGGDGNLYRCCVQSYNRHGLIGNVKEAGGLKALWDSETKRQKFRNFDARSCATCQFSDRNRAIDRAVKAETTPEAPPDLVHKSFV